jgi:peptide chain release factor subunit 1
MRQFGAERARALAEYRSARPAAISCFVNLDPATVPTATALRSHVSSVLTGLRRAVNEAVAASDQESAMRLREDADRIALFLESKLDRSSAQGLALFASSEHDVWEEFRLPRPCDDSVYVGRSFVIAPLLDHLEHDRQLVVVAVGRDRGVLWLLHHGQATLLEDLSRDGQGQHDQGGWSQPRYQRSRDHEALEHMRRVAEAITHHVRPGTGTLLVVACTDELRGAFELLLGSQVKPALLGFTEAEKQEGADDLAPRAEAMLEDRLEAERTALLERWREEIGQRSGRATSVWPEALTAAADGRIEAALVDGRTVRAYECTTCGRGFLNPGRCPLDATHLKTALGGALELLLHATFLADGDVRYVPEGIEETPGVAALLRYAAQPQEAPIGDLRR